MVECHVRVCRRHRLRNVNDFLMTPLKILGGKSPLFGSEVSPVTTYMAEVLAPLMTELECLTILRRTRCSKLVID